ncbi:MAG: error-prone DNA polymerase [Gammaproteobacteria bacterium]|nr:error-prone DNA polymerase [Gammaproteobacteria bacterium]MDP6615881.1 error-prone DNA polymerase [Gammaproteobacteria bacterium]MDP6694301.1 error-prone DNA polymerase [Gammaproteobacteria bacterium]
MKQAGHLLPAYAELHCISNFTFLRGASRPEELVARACELGYEAIAITDECSVASLVRAYMAAKKYGIRLITGSEFRLRNGLRVVLLATNQRGYTQLCTLITRARRAAPKGEYLLDRTDLAAGLEDCLLLWLAEARPDEAQAHWLLNAFPGRAWLAVELCGKADKKKKIRKYKQFSKRTSFPLVACGDIRMHRAERRALQDTLTAIRLGMPLDRAGVRLHPNGECYLRARDYLGQIYPPEWLAASTDIAARTDFSLADLDYQYPHELVPAGESASSWLRRLTGKGLRWRWPDGEPARVRRQVEYELRLIRELGYEAYFLTVHDIVRFARRNGILCQGRGSAANSAVCFCLGITEVDPGRMNMLIERFISKERNEPPDIDVDFEHERREEVIQYIYNKYGRSRAALTATVITYRPRSAIRDVGKALGLADLQVNRMARAMQWWDGKTISEDRVREAGLDPNSPLIRRLLVLVDQLLGFPRHLSQHVGGFLISERPLAEIVPVENAAMEDRTVIQWDKDDLDDLGLLKVDVLALGMLSAIHRGFDLLHDWYGRQLSMATVPAEDPAVYDMVSKGDTVGVFQIESRAQMAMLPRLKPRCYYDLVIEVALVRPGPIQGNMVHPYLRRRNGEEPVSYPSEAVRSVLERTLGVPIFQEQVMEIAIVAAGFSGGEADQLRRAMAAWKRLGELQPFEKRLTEGMRERGYSAEFARQIFRQIKGFGEYGFPESHAASFALLVYVSAWLKCFEPAIFACALLNSQPMGFYAPSQLVQDARKHKAEVRPVDVNHSLWDCTLETSQGEKPALRLGLRMVKGLAKQAALKLVTGRGGQAFDSVADLAARAGLDQHDYAALASADALQGIAGNRHRARWQVAGIESPLPVFPEPRFAEATPMLRRPTPMASVISDYASTGLSLRQHPLALVRPGLPQDCVTATELWDLQDGARVYVAGLVITRQRPGSTGNVTFVTLEDETGFINLVVWEKTAERQRQVLLNTALMGVDGVVQKQDGVLHVIVQRLQDHSALLDSLRTPSWDFH